MTSFLPSIPYPPPIVGDGYWGPVTSTLDWCEENYYATHYCAELINSFTNAMFIYLGYRGIRNCFANNHDRVFLVAWVAYLMIGIGSFWFHTTLTYSMQLVDEISMFYSTCILAYACTSYNRSLAVQIGLGIFTTVLTISISLIYFYLGDPVFHQVMFAFLTLLVVLHGIVNMELTLRPRWRKTIAAVQGRPERWTNGHGAVVRAKSEYEAQQRRDQEDLTLLKRLYQLLGFGVLLVSTGFAIWSLDRVVCGSLRVARRKIGMPWGFLLEGHAWWHLMTGVAGYINVVWNTWMRYALYGKRDEVELVWPSLWFSIPEVVRRENLREMKNVKKTQ